MKILLYLKYVGTEFCGFQFQPNARTVQGELTSAARKLYGGDCAITGCSRTDSGVHANCFCATLEPLFDSPPNIAEENIPRALNVCLPRDISVFSAKYVHQDFHPRYDAVLKEYVYLILNAPARDAFFADRAFHYPPAIPLSGVAEMNKAAGLLVGEHDFAAFMAQGSPRKTTVRTIKYASVEKNGTIIKITVAADGFLYNMMRIIVGTLINVGIGKTKADEISGIVASCDRCAAGFTAPPEGLYLNNVEFEMNNE